MRKSVKIIIQFMILFGISITAIQSLFAQGRNAGQTSFSNSSSMGYSREYMTHGMVGEAIIEFDIDTRSLIVITDDDTNEHIKQIIEKMDRPVPQVLIKVVFVEVIHRDDLDLGVEFGVQYDGGKGIIETVFGLDAQPIGGFYRILETDFQATMRAIQEVGKTEILSRPSILTRNNQEAMIIVGQEVPFVRNTVVTDSGQTTNTVEYEDIGIILRVTPFITPEGLVEMMISPEISTLTDETVQLSETTESPVFSKASADTVVTTPNGQTIVIGGMMEDNITDVVRKIPFLGDIPIVGGLFRRTIKDNQKTELLIFLTPIVVENPSGLPALSQYENSRTKMIPEVFSNSKLDLYLDNLGKNEKIDLNPVQGTLQIEEPEMQSKVEPQAEQKNKKRMKPLSLN